MKLKRLVEWDIIEVEDITSNASNSFTIVAQKIKDI